VIGMAVLGGLLGISAAEGESPPEASPTVTVERVTTRVYFPRGLAKAGEDLYVLSRGRVREYGGVSGDIDDQAGTIYKVDPTITQPISEAPTDAVKNNGEVVALPTAPPFRLFDRTVKEATEDRVTDRPYCGLRYHAHTQSFYICAFSGIDKVAKKKGDRTFSKSLTDGLLRYDSRTKKGYEGQRHDNEAGGNYPHHDPASNPRPRGWLNGPDNLLPVGNYLYAVAKDNS